MIRRSLRALRDAVHGITRLPRLARELEAIRTQTWHAKEAAWIAAHDGVILTAPRYADPRCLVPHQAQMYSQNGEDGVIAEVFRRIGTQDRFFVELGAGDGTENNTRLLLETGWRGVWAEADPAAAERIRSGYTEELAEGRLRLIDTPLTRENVGPLLRDAAVPEGFDFLSVDIDMNTGHVWEAIHEAGFRSRAACIEYNASVPPSVDWQVPYDPAGRWTVASNRFGAGLKTLENLGRAAEMSLVGCEFLGVNAFFVRATACGDQFLGPFTAEKHYEPPRYHLLNHRGHPKHVRQAGR